MKRVIAKKGAQTADIMQAMYNVVPAAAYSLKDIETPLDHLHTGNAVQDARNFAGWIHKNIQYVADGYHYQVIVLPQKLLITRKGDCKSFSLLLLSTLSKYGYNNGLRFASYKENKAPTHVYNFVIDEKGNKYTFDACVKGLKESPNATFIQDMQVEYLAGLPVIINESQGIERRRRVFQRVAMAPGRAAFLGIVSLNFRGLATKLSKVNQGKLKSFWEKLGGQFSKLQNAISKGKAKRPLLGGGRGVNGTFISDDEAGYIGIDPATASAIAAAAPIILAAVNFLKKEGISTEADTVPTGTQPIDAGAGFTVTDPEPGVTPQNVQTQAAGFQVSPILLLGGAAALFLILNKKR